MLTQASQPRQLVFMAGAVAHTCGPESGRQRQEGRESEASLGYTVRQTLSQKINK